MPSLPITVAKILEITKDPQSTPNDLNRVITLDPVLTGKVLKLVNSAYYNLANEVTTIVKAIIMLGLNTIKNLAISTAVLGSMRKKENFVALNMDGYWRHSIGVGAAAKLLAVKMNVDPKVRDEYFIAGLLHDIGKIVMNQHFNELYLNAISQADLQKRPLWQIEDQLMQINHARVGQMIAEKWQLSQPLTQAITFHHQPLEAVEEHRRIVFTIALANNFCVENDIGFSGNRSEGEIPDEIMQYLMLSERDLFQLEDSIESEIAKASVFLQMSERKG